MRVFASSRVEPSRSFQFSLRTLRPHERLIRRARCSRRVILTDHPPMRLFAHSLDGGERGISARAPDASRVPRRRPRPCASEGRRSGVLTPPARRCMPRPRHYAHAASAKLRRLAGRRCRPSRASMMTRSGGWRPPACPGGEWQAAPPVQAPRAFRVATRPWNPLLFVLSANRIASVAPRAIRNAVTWRLLTRSVIDHELRSASPAAQKHAHAEARRLCPIWLCGIHHWHRSGGASCRIRSEVHALLSSRSRCGSKLPGSVESGWRGMRHTTPVRGSTESADLVLALEPGSPPRQTP